MYKFISSLVFINEGNRRCIQCRKIDYSSHIPDECLAFIFLARVTEKVLFPSVVVGFVSNGRAVNISRL